MNVLRVSSFTSSLRGLLVASLLLPAATLTAAVATLRPSKDNTIYGDGSPALSNGAGSFLFVGSSGQKRALRSLVAFDLSQIPAGATINSVSLTMAVNTPMAGNRNTVRLHRLLADWGEGSSRASSGEGGGAPATTGDVTWTARFFNTLLWTTPGGDFSATVSASQSVNTASGNVTFSSTGLVADVQAWVNASATNFGWILIAQDEGGPAVRFSSRTGASAPSLVIDYTASTGGGNSAPVIATQPASQSVTVGATVSFTIAATGTPAPTLQWRKDGTNLANATNATLTLPNVTSASAGGYSVVATNSVNSVTSDVATLTVNSVSTGITARLSNLSVRAAMSSGQTLFVGFAVAGGSRTILARAVGPTLATLGLAGTMNDPRLELYNDTTLVAQNDDWGNSAALSSAFTSVGAFALVANSRDAALLQVVDGTRSVQVKGTGPGVALVELYDTGSGLSPRLVNVSARNQVGTGDNILIFGFFIDGTGTKNLLIRAVGPRLADLGVTGVLTDPKLDVFREGSSVAVTSNDNWAATLAPTFESVGAFALTPGSRDAAIVTSLTPGAYTVQVSGVNGATGEALVEIYELP